MTDHGLSRGQRVVLDSCPGFDINNLNREFFGEFVVEDVLPREIGLYPLHPDRYAHPEDQMVFVNLPLPGEHHFRAVKQEPK